jgi:hypothetical protein
MANESHLSLLKRGVEAWNQWRKQNPRVMPGPGEAFRPDELLSAAHLSGANLSGMDLNGANLSAAHLSRANLSRADLSMAGLSGANPAGLVAFDSTETK